MIPKAKATYTKLYDKPTTSMGHEKITLTYCITNVFVKGFMPNRYNKNDKQNWYKIDNKPLGLGSSLV